MKKHFYFVYAGLIVSSVLLAGCGHIGEDTIRVATDATWPPFEMVDDETKELVGLDIDLMQAIAIKAGFEVEFVNVSFDTLLAGMTQCQYEAAISALTITPDRAADFNFSVPYFSAGQVVVVRLDNEDITGPDDLSLKIVGVQTDTTGDIEAQKIEGATVQRYDDIGLAFQDLMNGQLEAVIADYPMALGIVGQNPELLKIVGDIFTDENYGIAICKTNTELVERINVALAELVEEGYIDELTQTWIIGGG
jgi:polar amino acid transport system substrate-binding protein